MGLSDLRMHSRILETNFLLGAQPREDSAGFYYCQMLSQNPSKTESLPIFPSEDPRIRQHWQLRLLAFQSFAAYLEQLQRCLQPRGSLIVVCPGLQCFARTNLYSVDEPAVEVAESRLRIRAAVEFLLLDQQRFPAMADAWKGAAMNSEWAELSLARAAEALASMAMAKQLRKVEVLEVQQFVEMAKPHGAPKALVRALVWH